MIKTILRPALILMILLTLITGVFYPWLVAIMGQTCFPKQTMGSLIVRNGKLSGSELIGQNFTEPRFFWGRPSATALYPYNAQASGGSNLGSSNPVFIQTVKARIIRLRQFVSTPVETIPVDLVTASGSGLDPEISPAAAYYQVNRVAQARGLSVVAVRTLVNNFIVERQLGFLGEPRVNVLELNLALEQLDAYAPRFAESEDVIKGGHFPTSNQ